MKPSFSADLFSTLPIIGILRGFTPDQVIRIVRSAIRGGLRNIEITMNSPGAEQQITQAVEIAEGRLNVGAGTVTDQKLLHQALAAGAAFIVTPTVNPPVIAECVREKVPVFPGALSPTEIVAAWEQGATMVKIFPAESVGPGYLRSVKAPLPHIKLMPTGGVDLESLSAFAKAGADGFGIGGPLFDRDRIAAGDWEWIERRCRAFAEAHRRALGD